MQDVLDIEVTPLASACGAEIKGVDLTKPLSEDRGGNQGRLGQASRAGVPGPEGFPGRPASVRFLFRRSGQPQEGAGKAPQSRRGSPAGPRKGPAGDQHQGRWQSDRRVRRRRILVPHRFRLFVASPTSTRSSMRSNCRPPAATRCSPTCTRPTRRCPPRSRRSSRARRRSTSTNTTAQSRPAIQATSAGSRTTYHPVFITHPDTRRKTLFVDRLMTTRIEGVSAEESNAILEQLYDIGERREFIFEHVWKLGDFLMWDNRCTIHARTDFPKEERRLLRRCTVEGEPLHE